MWVPGGGGGGGGGGALINEGDGVKLKIKESPASACLHPSDDYPPCRVMPLLVY